MVRTLDTYRNDGDEFPFMPKGVLIYVLGTDEMSCAQRIEYVLGLPVSEQQKLVKEVAPVSEFGWIPDSCLTGADDWKIYDPGDGTGGFIPADGTTTNPTNPPTNNPTIDNSEDQAGWQNLGIYQSSQNPNV